MVTYSISDYSQVLAVALGTTLVVDVPLCHVLLKVGGISPRAAVADCLITGQWVAWTGGTKMAVVDRNTSQKSDVTITVSLITERRHIFCCL